MVGKIIIERLEFQGRCGVTSEERRRPQPLAVDLELDCQTEPAATWDDIHRTVNYAQVADRVIEIGTTQDCALLETFAERLLTMLFAEFPIEQTKIWVRKLAPPLEHVTGSVGVQLERSRLAPRLGYGTNSGSVSDSTTPSLTERQGPRRRGWVWTQCALSSAHGFQVDAMDRDEQTMTQLAATAKQRNLPNLTVRTVDLERKTEERPEFPKREDHLIVGLLSPSRAVPALIDSLKPNGVLI